jgi:DNA polymerase-3 subunit delta'
VNDLNSLLETLASKPAQAYLVIGHNPASFAKNFIAKIYCPRRCGSCSHCHKLQTGTHPDLFWVTKSGKRMSIDQIRELQQQALYAPLEASKKIYVLEGVEDLSLEAANSLLKILESPPSFLIFLLLARSQNLLPTIISRCQVIKLPKPSEETIASGLRQRGWKEAAIEYLLSVTRGNEISDDLQPSRNILEERDQLRQRLSQTTDAELWESLRSENLFARREANLEILRRLRRWNVAETLRAAAALSDCPTEAIRVFIEEATYWCRDLLTEGTETTRFHRDGSAELAAIKTDSTKLAEALRALETAPWKWQRQNANLQLLLESLLFTLRAALA